MNSFIHTSKNLKMIVVAIVLGLSMGHVLAGQNVQATFKTPELAVKTLQTALKNNNIPALLNIFGEQYKSAIDTSDKAAETVRRSKFYRAITAGYKIETLSADKVAVLVGKDDTPFSIPLIKTKSGWQFDSRTGIEEVINRRTGQNELAAIAACHAILDAQLEYAKTDHDNDGVLEFAQKFKSNPGDRDGLYWASPKGAARSERSPLEQFVTDAGDYLYARTTSRDPYKGYHFKIISSQGPNAAGGEYSYIIKNNMTAGFAVIAWPAEYDNTGIMTFMMSHEGSILEKDLGKNTTALATNMGSFNPDKSWQPTSVGAR